MRAADVVLAAGYVIATVLACRAAIAMRTASGSAAGSRGSPCDQRRLSRLWIATAIVVVLLGSNRALGTHEWVMRELRSSASAEGWYLDRRRIQKIVVVLLLGVGVVVALVLWRMFRRSMARALGPLIGVTLLVSYVAIRLVSLHSIDATLASGPVAMGRLLECSGLALIAVSALRAGPARAERRASFM